jgi:hypothetical protein
MLRTTLTFAALLGASPALALSVSSAACNDQAAELVVDGTGATLTANGRAVALPDLVEPGARWDGLRCLSRDGATVFGLTQQTAEGDEAHFLLDPATGALAAITYEEAGALGFWEDEDDWDLGLLDD